MSDLTVKLDRVISGWEYCASDDRTCPKECPYNTDVYCKEGLEKETLDVLKELREEVVK